MRGCWARRSWRSALRKFSEALKTPGILSRVRTVRGFVARNEGQVPRLNEALRSFYNMKKCFVVLFSLCCFGLSQAQEIDVTRLEKIGPVTGFIKTERGITLNCGDNSQVQVTVLAPDLIRIRASFAKPVP